MKDWFVAFVAAASLLGLVLWCAYVFIKAVYG
jgi:hypothetical protein